MVAGNLRSLCGLDFADEGVSFVSEASEAGVDLWIYAVAGAGGGGPNPCGKLRPLLLTIENQSVDCVRPADDLVRFRLPNALGSEKLTGKRLWHAQLKK